MDLPEIDALAATTTGRLLGARRERGRDHWSCSFCWRLALWAVLLFLQAAPTHADLQFRSTGSNDKLVLLVHGLWGDPMESFGDWPLVMVNDRFVLNGQSLSQFSVAALGYPARRSDRLTPQQAAQNLLEELLIEFKTRDYQEIYFVAHSLGGIIVKQMLVDALARDSQLVERTRAVFLIAVPSANARLGSMLSRLPLGRAMAGPIIKYLLTPEGTKYLRGLDDRWSDLVVGRDARIRFGQYCAYETRPMGLGPFAAIVVPQLQSESACTSKFIANNENHVSIVKPDMRSPVHTWVRNNILAVSGPSPMMPWAPISGVECKPFPEGTRFRVGGFGLLKRHSFTAEIERDECGSTIVATVVERGNRVVLPGNASDACTGHLHYNSLVSGTRLTIPRSCVNDAGR